MALRANWQAMLFTVVAALFGLGEGAWASPALVVDVETGAVLFDDMGTAPWYPASLTKLMTTYVALSKVREGKLSLDTPLRVSARAAAMAPSKMGFRPGTLVTLDNALKMLMVKSPNDVAVTVAEGVSGSVEAFADEMNAYAFHLGLRESHFVNPNGLPNEHHVSSARDMAMIGRALLRDFPEQRALFGIGALSFNGRIINNHNGLLGRYDGVDGMKTGYTCSAGYNIVASAQRGDKHLIAVVMGAVSLGERSRRVTSLFERFFATSGGGSADVAALPPSDIVLPPDMRGQVCGPGRRNAIMEAEVEDALVPLAPGGPLFGGGPERAQIIGMAGGVAPAGMPAPSLGPSGGFELLHARTPFDPVRVYIGPAPGWKGTPNGPIEAAAPGPGKRGNPARPPFAAPDKAEPSLPAAAAGDLGGGVPMALAGAVPAPAALAAANRAVKRKGHLPPRVAARDHKPSAGKGRPVSTPAVKKKTAPKKASGKARAR